MAAELVLCLLNGMAIQDCALWDTDLMQADATPDFPPCLCRRGLPTAWELRDRQDAHSRLTGAL